MQPKLKPHTIGMLENMGLRASLYQPVHLFVKNGRKLPNCAEPGDPWECFLRKDNGEFGVVSRAVAATPDEAVIAAVWHRPGLRPAMLRLESAVTDLVETFRAC